MEPPRPLMWTLTHQLLTDTTHAIELPIIVLLCFIYLFAVDAVALRITFISFSFLGEFERMRDMFARSIIHWTEDMQLYPYVLGL